MIRAVLVCVLFLVFQPLQAAQKDEPPDSYRLGIFPYMAHRQTVEFFGPVASNMEKALNHSVRLETVRSFSAFTEELEKQSYDIALIQPFDFPSVVDKYGYLPIAQFSVPLISQFYVRDDSQYKNIEDLRGTVIAMPPETAASTKMTLRALYDHKLIPGSDVEIRYFKSHDSCIQQVWAGNASACGTAKPPILIFQKRMQARLRSIYDTSPIPHVLFVANPRVPAEDRAILQKLITGWRDTEDGRRLLKNLGFPGFVVPKPSDYTVMHNYEPSTHISEPTFTADSKVLIFGIFPFVGPRQLIHNFSPVLPVLSKTVGKKVHLRTAANFDNFSNGLASSTFDIVLVQPFDYALAKEHGYLPIAGMKKMLQSTFFVLENSKVKQVSDFKGKVVAMPPANAAVSHLGRMALSKAGLHPGKDVTIDYRKTHESCLLQVQNGEAEACSTARIALNMVSNKLGQGLRSVGSTEKIPGILFMVHKRVPAKIRKQLQAEIISWNNSNKGRKILQSIHFGEFKLVDNNDYNHLPKAN